MSCNCGSITVVLPPNVCPTSGTYTASNANLAGQGVYFDQVGNEFQFYGLTNTDGYVVISLDAPNNAISIDINPELIAGSIPDSTTTVKGKTAYATDAEAVAKTSTVKALTASNLAALASSTTFAGLTEYATNAETQAGASGTLAVTPVGLKSVTDALAVTRVAVNSVARGSAAPAFAGQLLMQLDTEVLYKGDSTTAGDWSLAAVPRTGVVDTPNLTFVSNNGELEMADTETRTTMFFSFETGFQVDQILNISSTTQIQRSGTAIPADHILGTSSIAGELTSFAVSDFLSVYNNIPYTVGAYTTSRSGGDSATVTLEQLADFVFTLVTDLKASIKPGT